MAEVETKKEIVDDFIVGKHRRYAFTWNNYTPEEVETLKGLDARKVDYLIFGFEKGEETGTPHLQGYVEFGSPIAMVTAKNRLDPVKKKASSVKLMLPKKVAQANINYCKKEETTDQEAVEKYGGGKKYIEIIHKTKRQGERTDWHEKFEFLEEKTDFLDFAREYPECAFKYYAGIDRMIHAIKERKQREQHEERYTDVVLQPWQASLIRELQKPANDRKIIWIWGNEGKKGKTWISNYIVAKCGGVRFCNAACKDVAHAYDGEGIVAFDFTRTTTDRINYQIIEELKGGSIFSPKYNSRFKYFATPHIVCFANAEPMRAAMSQDRWDIRCLDDVHIALPVPDKMPQAPLEDEPIGLPEPVEPVEIPPIELEDMQPRNTSPNGQGEAAREDNIEVSDDEVDRMIEATQQAETNIMQFITKTDYEKEERDWIDWQIEWDKFERKYRQKRKMPRTESGKRQYIERMDKAIENHMKNSYPYRSFEEGHELRKHYLTKAENILGDI